MGTPPKSNVLITGSESLLMGKSYRRCTVRSSQTVSAWRPHTTLASLVFLMRNRMRRQR